MLVFEEEVETKYVQKKLKKYTQKYILQYQTAVAIALCAKLSNLTYKSWLPLIYFITYTVAGLAQSVECLTAERQVVNPGP